MHTQPMEARTLNKTIRIHTNYHGEKETTHADYGRGGCPGKRYSINTIGPEGNTRGYTLLTRGVNVSTRGQWPRVAKLLQRGERDSTRSPWPRAATLIIYGDANKYHRERVTAHTAYGRMLQSKRVPLL